MIKWKKNISKLVKEAQETASEATEPKKVSSRKVDDYMGFMIFLALIGMVYIWNSHLAESQTKKMDDLTHEVKALKSRYVLRKADLSAVSRYSEISENADSIGLNRLTEPPYKIVKVNKEK